MALAARFVDNVASAIALAAVSEQAAGRVYNVAETPSVLRNASGPVRSRPRQAGTGEFVVLPKGSYAGGLMANEGNSAQHWEADSSRIRNELGYREPVPLDEAIRRTIEWESANPPGEFNPNRFDYEAEDGAVSLYSGSTN